ncbi:Hypp4437 [Branchiostoma lanceolatum]|uniref:Hypp4437 protein n=1 Tax=Branchiostoma lanceolatum TaxID=7740 RepID=A0A8K0EVW6_BRALA|nr:Hypp4437 [Branchiostoma lanceolatum]
MSDPQLITSPFPEARMFPVNRHDCTAVLPHLTKVQWLTHDKLQLRRKMKLVLPLVLLCLAGAACALTVQDLDVI